MAIQAKYAGVSIPTDGNREFRGVLRGPASPQSCLIQFRMIQEGVGRFGRTVTAPVNIVEAVNGAVYITDTIPAITLQLAERFVQAFGEQVVRTIDVSPPANLAKEWEVYK